MRAINQFLVVAVAMLAVAGCSSSSKKEAERSQAGESYDPSTQLPGPAKVEQKSGYVFDGGQLVPGKEDQSISAMGGKNAVHLKEEKFISLDREKFAPIGKILYVMSDEIPSRCIKAQFTKVDGKKVLVAYSRSTVPTNYCVYQKTYSADGQGFSVYLKSGPLCRPSYFTNKEDNQKRKVASVEDVAYPVSFTYCVDGTVSYGETAAARH